MSVADIISHELKQVALDRPVSTPAASAKRPFSSSAARKASHSGTDGKEAILRTEIEEVLNKKKAKDEALMAQQVW